MAIARTTRQIIITGLTLELTREEARTLLYVLNQVGGSTQTSARAVVDGIRTALGEADVTTLSGLDKGAVHNGSTYFRDGSLEAFKDAK